MRRRAILITGVATSAAVAIAALAETGVPKRDAAALTFRGQPVTAAEIAAGRELYAESCASCHGDNLEGQPDWRRRLENGRMPAPPHDESGHSWHHADRLLFDITKKGVVSAVNTHGPV